MYSIYICIYIYTYTHVYIYMYIQYTYAYVYIYICTYVCMYVCMCIYIYILQVSLPHLSCRFHNIHLWTLRDISGHSGPTALFRHKGSFYAENGALAFALHCALTLVSRSRTSGTIMDLHRALLPALVPLSP